jgi:hypothetical protein
MSCFTCRTKSRRYRRPRDGRNDRVNRAQTGIPARRGGCQVTGARSSSREERDAHEALPKLLHAARPLNRQIARSLTPGRSAAWATASAPWPRQRPGSCAGTAPLGGRPPATIRHPTAWLTAVAAISASNAWAAGPTRMGRSCCAGRTRPGNNPAVNGGSRTAGRCRAAPLRLRA